MRIAVILLFLLTAFGFTTADADGCAYRASVLNHADPAMTVSDLRAEPGAFTPLTNGSSGLFEGRSDTGVLWMRFEPAPSADCNGPLWMQAKYPYLHDATLYALGTGEEPAAEAEPVARLSFQYPAWALSDRPDEAPQSYLLKIVYPDRLILPYRIDRPAVIIGDLSVFGLISLSLVILLLALAVQAGALGQLLSRTDTAAFIGFTVFSAIYVILSSGLLDVMLQTSAAVDTRQLLLTSQAVLLWTAVEFLRANMKVSAPLIVDRILLGLQYAAIPTVLAPYFGPAADRLAFAFAFIAAPLIILVLLGLLTLKGRRGAAGLLLAWSPTILATVWIYGRLLGITPYHPINHHLIGIGLLLTALRFNTILTLKYRGEARAARHDSLTGLPNRRALTQAARRYDDNGLAISALAIMDLRKFKAVNDTFGHAAGDRVLIELSQRVTRTLPKGARLFRIGGDEFVILIENVTDELGVKRLLGRISDIAAEPVAYMEQPISVAANIGAVLGPIPDGVSFSRLMGAADKLAYSAKSSGKSDVLARRWSDIQDKGSEFSVTSLHGGKPAT